MNGLGPIPFSAYVRFGEFYDMEKEDIDQLIFIISKCDALEISLINSKIKTK